LPICAYQLKLTNKITGDQYLITFHDLDDRANALAIYEEYGLVRMLEIYSADCEEFTQAS